MMLHHQTITCFATEWRLFHIYVKIITDDAVLHTGSLSLCSHIMFCSCGDNISKEI